MFPSGSTRLSRGIRHLRSGKKTTCRAFNRARPTSRDEAALLSGRLALSPVCAQEGSWQLGVHTTSGWNAYERTIKDMTTVAVAVTDGMPLFELGVPCAIFGPERSALADPWYELKVCASAGTEVGGWFRADTPNGLDALVAADTVIVPACHDVTESPPSELLDALQEAHRRGARVASICTGAFILAAAGLLDGRRATTHWMHAALLAERYPHVQVDPDVLYVDEGSVLTSAGKAAGIDMCLHMVRTDYGTAVANALARVLVAAPHRPGGQAQYIQTPMPKNDEHGLGNVLAWALAHLDEPLTVADLAQQAGMSPRNIGRRFTAVTGSTPLQWLLTQRIHRARELLEYTDESIDHIAEQVGMGTAATLRRHFNRVMGVPPDTYRRTFHHHAQSDSTPLTASGPKTSQAAAPMAAGARVGYAD
jgi:AraC family transcriptional regulator, transcriptional activator FtrA